MKESEPKRDCSGHTLNCPYNPNNINPELLREIELALVPACFACPKCGEREQDNLANDAGTGLVTCFKCGFVYDPLELSAEHEIELAFEASADWHKKWQEGWHKKWQEGKQ